MSIKSTQTITRTEAINRIKKVLYLIENKDFNELNEICFEPNIEITEDSINIALSNVSDVEFFRKSMFDNYEVVND